MKQNTGKVVRIWKEITKKCQFFFSCFFSKYFGNSYYDSLQANQVSSENLRWRTKNIISFTKIFGLIFCQRCAIPTTNRDKGCQLSLYGSPLRSTFPSIWQKRVSQAVVAPL